MEESRLKSKSSSSPILDLIQKALDDREQNTVTLLKKANGAKRRALELRESLAFLREQYAARRLTRRGELN